MVGLSFLDMARAADGHTVVVGVDGSAEGTEALRYAVGAAKARGMWLLVVHAYELPPRGAFVAAAVLDAAALASAYRVTSDALSQVDIPADVTVETAVELTTPVLMLQQLSGQVALIVLGQHTADPFHTVHTRPVSSSVAASSCCPMVIVPPSWSRHPAGRSRSIVVGLDTETSARVVLGFAFREAERRGWSVIALQVLPSAGLPAHQLARAADIEAIIASQRRDHPAVPVTVAVTMDSLAEVILDDSRRARLLVVGSPHGHNGRPGAWSYAAAQKSLQDLYCPLAVVPEPRTETDSSATRRPDSGGRHQSR